MADMVGALSNCTREFGISTTLPVAALGALGMNTVYIDLSFDSYTMKPSTALSSKDTSAGRKSVALSVLLN
jgi:hypothetical protein